MRILIVVPPERFDWYYYLPKNQEIEYILLWYVKSSEMQLSLEELPLKFKEVIYWSTFRSPKSLLQEVKPHKIVFFEIIDLRQIALIVASKGMEIPTFYLEHGAAGDKETAILQMQESSFKKDKLPYLVKRFFSSFFEVIKSKWFYFSVTYGFSSFYSYQKYLKLPFLMLQAAPNKVLSKVEFRERVPDHSIVFSQANFEQYKLYTHISLKDAILSGVPFFDKFYKAKDLHNEHIIFIDHPYLEENLLGWTSEHHRKIAETLFQFAEVNKTKVFIKLHPRSKAEIWNMYSFNKEYIEIIQQGDFTDLYLTSKLILGFSSSLMNGFICARKNIVLLGWHPHPQIFGADFSRTGLCHVSFNPEDLIAKFEDWKSHNLTLENSAVYDQFLLQYNYPFDGRATERVINTIFK